MNTLILSGYGIKLRYRKGTLVVESKAGVQEALLASVDQIVVATSGVWLSSKVVRKAIEHGVDLVFLDSRGLPVGRVYPPYVNKTVETRRAQYLAYTSSRGLHVARELVYAKISNQASLLRKYFYYTRISELHELASRIFDLAARARSVETSFEEAREKLRAIESEAARLYWPGYALLLPRDLGFQGRDQDSGDPVNTSLNYAYGVLYGECWRALVLAGLDPYAGFMHVDRSGKPVLVFDFIEMFRFIADSAVLWLFRHNWRPRTSSGLLDYESRAKIIEVLSRFMDDTKVHYVDESPTTLRQALKKVAHALASYLRGEGVFEGFVYRW